MPYRNDRKRIILQAGGERIEVFKSCLKEWISLDEIKEEISKNPTADNIYAYVSKATSRGVDFWENLPWFEVIQAYYDISLLNRIEIDLPLLDNVSGKVKVDPWDYKGRGWYAWLNMLARSYGWTGEYIAKLEVETAFALFQEIETDRQLQREWEWQITELAYPLNMTTKKSEFHALPRPGWMQTRAAPPKAAKIKRSLLPVGNVVDLMHYAKPDESV